MGKGTISLMADNDAILRFEEIKYWDASQIWRIQYRKGRVTTRDLGGKSRWSGSGDEWKVRLADLRAGCQKALLEKVTARKAKDRKPSLNRGKLGTSNQGRPFFVTSALEEQMVGLVLAELNGARLSEVWPELEKVYPARILVIAGQIIERIVSQCRGNLAPKKSRSVKFNDRTWDLSDRLVPFFHWTDGGAWYAQREKVIVASREKLGKLREEAVLRQQELARVRPPDVQEQNDALEKEWDEALKKELASANRKIGKRPRSDFAAATGAFFPVRLKAGKATFSMEEKKTLTGDRVKSSRVDIRGTVRDLTMMFWDPITNTQKEGVFDFSPWYKASVRRISR